MASQFQQFDGTGMVESWAYLRCECRVDQNLGFVGPDVRLLQYLQLLAAVEGVLGGLHNVSI